MAAITALRRAGRGAVALEVDGRPWGVVSEDVVLRTGLLVGTELDRPALRRLRKEVARARAHAVAGRALSRRELSERQLRDRLGRAGVDEGAVAETLADLVRAGALDDARYARLRAEGLGARGYGDAVISDRLGADGVEDADVRAALETLPAESERARALVAHSGPRERAKLARRLRSRGFSAESVDAALGGLDYDDLGELGYVDTIDYQ